MKLSISFWVGICSLTLLMVTIFSAMNLPFNWVFYLTVFGQVLVVLMVWKVLTDNYQTPLEFKDGYGDNPLDQSLE